MVASDWHLLAQHAAVLPTRAYLGRRRPDLYISGELAIRYRKPDGSAGQVAPDMLAAYAPQHLRSSFDVEVEGAFPAFVLEIVSPESSRRDKEDKARLYGLLEAQEYAIFDPRGRAGRQLWGYRRDERGTWSRWPSRQAGGLHSHVLGLTLEAEGTLLRFRDEQGSLIPLHEELAAALAEEREARAHVEGLLAASEARAAALEAELVRLRRGE